jgi:DNA-binding NtrC family response regulator
LLAGEIGVGKEACAATLHRESRRRAQPFFSLHLDGLGEQEATERLFGPRGIVSLAARARQATVYLDAVETLPVILQQRLVGAFVDDGLGGVRLLAGTRNPALEEQVRLGRFLRALHDRIAIIQVCIPPLRERREDIPLITEGCLWQWSARQGASPQVLTDGALAEIEAYTWPGNARELANVLETLCTDSRGRTISAERVRAVLGRRPRRNLARDVLPLREMERHYIECVLARCGGNQTLAARRLGIGRSTLLRHLKANGMAAAARPAARPSSPGRSSRGSLLPACERQATA